MRHTGRHLVARVVSRFKPVRSRKQCERAFVACTKNDTLRYEAQAGYRMKKVIKKKTARIGSSFDDFLKEDGIYVIVTARAIKRVLVRQLDELMRREEISKTELATRMKTSRAQLDRLLDPENESVTLGTLARAAQAVGRHLRLDLV